MSEIKSTIFEARNLFNSQDFGVLSTISVKLNGIPFGSLVPYCIDKDGQPVVLISRIAEHTHNINSDSRSSITILNYDQDDVQSKARITISGKMEIINNEESEVKNKYYRYFPNSVDYNTVHDFSFYKLKLISIRYIGGFGKIYWLEGKDFLLTNPFAGEDEIQIIEHMNQDHLKDLILYCKHYKHINIKKQDDLSMVGIDSHGFDLLFNLKKLRFTFKHTINTLADAREAMVQMSKSAS